MKLILNYPETLTCPKGLHIPRLEDVQQAVRLTEILTKYIDLDFEEGDEIPVSVNDEVFILEGKLVDASLTEGVTLYPSASRWAAGSIFGAILSTLIGDKPMVAISKINLTEIAKEMEDLVNFVWNLRDKLPVINEFCLKHDYIVDTATSLEEKVL